MIYKYQCNNIKFQIKTNSTKDDCLLFAEIYYSYNPATKKYFRLKYYTDLRIVKDKWDQKNQCAKKGMTGKAEFDLRIIEAKEKFKSVLTVMLATLQRNQTRKHSKRYYSKNLQAKPYKPKMIN